MNRIHRVPFGTVRTLIGRVSHQADDEDDPASPHNRGTFH